MSNQFKSKIISCQNCHQEREALPTSDVSMPDEPFGKCPVCGAADYVVLTENELHERDIARARADKAKAEAKKAVHEAKKAEEEARHERKKADKTDAETNNQKKEPYWQTVKMITAIASVGVTIFVAVMKAKDK